MTKRFARISIAFTSLLLLLAGNVIAGTPFPTIHEPEGKECVEPEDEMKRNHMNYILHQRDETMHKGIRTSKYSLAECIDCHVYPDEQGNIANHDDKEHFCNACHEYASVQIDCFECHADKPQEFIKRGKKTASIKQQLQQMLVSDSDSNEGNQE